MDGSTRPKLPKLDHLKGEKRPRKTGEKKPNPLISATEKCKICYEPAARHIHYGAVTCFSCRAFFRRSIQSQAYEAYKCRKQGQCEMTLKSRKSCQKCRFEKCLDIGMKSSWVLSEEERFRRFRKHREKMEQQRQPDYEMNDDHDQSSNSSQHRTHSGSYDHHGSMSGHNSDTENEPRFTSRQGPPCYSPPPLSPITRNHLNVVPDSNFVPPSRSQFSQQHYLSNFFRDQVFPPTMAGSHFMSSSIQIDPMVFNRHPPGPSYQPEEEVRYSRLFPNIKEEVFETSDTDSDDSDDQPREDNGVMLQLIPILEDISPDELAQIKDIARSHDMNYKSVNFGEELIKEMVMSSVFGVPLSVNATMNAYRLMIQRVTKVAQGFDPFTELPHPTQSQLLKNNADMIVSLRGAVFFEKRKGGLDQILITMGVDDLLSARAMVMTAMKTTELKRIDYQTFNSLQKAGDSVVESRYNTLLQRVGTTVSFDPDLVKMLSYILLFSVDFTETDNGIRKKVEGTQDLMVSMMRRYIYAQYTRPLAIKLFSGLLHCIADLHELTWIKRQRQLAQPVSNIAKDRGLSGVQRIEV